MKVHNGTDLKNLFQDDSDDDGGDEDDDSNDDEDESEEEEEEDSKMDTSAGSTPFKKQKGQKQKENGASPKKDKPKDNKVLAVQIGLV